MTEHLTHFGSLADRYDGFIVDLWGVIHDGIDPYPGAVGCLEALRHAGKRVVLLSNAPRRADAVRHTLRRIGIPDDAYDGVLTSGEATRTALIERPDDWFRALGDRVWHLGPAKDESLFDEVPVRRVSAPADADFVLNTGPDDRLGENDPAPYLPALHTCAALGLPMLCANPDLEIVRGGIRIICAGRLAQIYATMGCDVRQIGKPDPAIYGPVQMMLGVDRNRTLAVGDSLATDIAGAAAAGVESCWVLGGIHGASISANADADTLLATAGLSPVATIPRFAW